MKTPAPMVAASATAILNDIKLSDSFDQPAGADKFPPNLAKRRFAHAFSTACVNREVSVGPRGLSDCGQTKEMLRTK
jgi:hypothetical protein